jgi:hypothetical protein
MSKKSSDWYVPLDWAFQFGWLLVCPAVAILASFLLPALGQIKEAKAINLFYSGLILGCFGIVLLFLARLPLYRQRKFLSFGSRELPAFHRKLYWLAYVFVVASVLSLAFVWLKVK